MLELAHKTNTEIDEDQPVIKYEWGASDIPGGFRAGRTHLNYSDTGENLTEILMVGDVLQTLFADNIGVVDTKSAGRYTT